MPMVYRSNPTMGTADPATGDPNAYGLTDTNQLQTTPDGMTSPALDALKQLGSASPSSGMVANPNRLTETTTPDFGFSTPSQGSAISYNQLGAQLGTMPPSQPVMGLQAAVPTTGAKTYAARPLSQQPLWPPQQTAIDG